MQNLNQQILDNILCYQGAIKQIDEKLKLISFLSSVDHSFVPTDLLNMNDLKQEKKSLEKNLKILKMSCEA